ncbi:MAG: OmpA family protein [Prevotellaceae bacterium]|jgi:outer membrane protein OmpA-like peptidoglycan-associated protein|nr:OmpA family protein [Prevotellaceae bacterium]
MRKWIWICLLFPFSGMAAQENISVNADPEFTRYYSVLNKEGLSPYRFGRVAFFEEGIAYTAKLDEKLEKSSIRPAPELNRLGIEGHFTYDDSSKKIYFSKGGLLYSSVWKGNRWDTPETVTIARIKTERQTLPGSIVAYSGWRYKPDDIQVQGKIYNPALSSDGKKLYYAADLPGTLGGSDIWYSTLEKDGTWSVPVNLGENVNSASDENVPVLQGDTSIFFASVTPQPEDTQDANTRPLPEESRFSTKNEMNMYFTPLTFDQPALAIADLLVKPDPAPELEPIPVLSETVDAVDSVANSNIYLQDPKTCVFLFDYDNDNLVGNYNEEIAFLLKFINRYEDGKFMIEGYTDERGSEAYNQALSVKRAKKIYQILIEKGISKERLKYAGKGKADPVVKNAQTEEEHLKNRRVVIRNVE